MVFIVSPWKPNMFTRCFKYVHWKTMHAIHVYKCFEISSLETTKTIHICKVFRTVLAGVYDPICLRLYWVFQSLIVSSSPNVPEPQTPIKPCNYVWFSLFSMKVFRKHCKYVWLSLLSNEIIDDIVNMYGDHCFASEKNKNHT